MDWVLLIVGVPLIAVPVVLLFGFAGCAKIAGLESPTEPTPPAPTLTSAVAMGTTGVTLTWTPDTSAVFFVERALVGSTAVFVPVPLGPAGALGVTGATATDSVLTGLTEGRTHRYRIRRTRANSDKSNPSTVRRVTTFPNRPDGLQTTFAGPGRVRFRWLNHTAASPVEFEIERQSPAGTGTFQLVGTVPDVSEFEDSDAAQATLKSGTTHRYRVTAVIPSGFADDAVARVKSEVSADHDVAIV